MSALRLAFEITWDPGLRGILVVLAGLTVLPGSVYLLLSTNLGARVGLLVAIAGLSGWMAVMGFVWAIYGIGYKGPASHWKVEEVVTSEAADDLSAARLEKAHDLSKWKELKPDDPARGEAQAAASAALIEENGPLGETFKGDADFIAIDAFEIGGKKETFVNNWLPGPHPPHYSMIQVQPVVEVDVPFGETPPKPAADTTASVYSVILVRDLGALRLPSVTLMISMLIVFGITCNSLHRRDKALFAARAAAAAE